MQIEMLILFERTEHVHFFKGYAIQRPFTMVCQNIGLFEGETVMITKEICWMVLAGKFLTFYN